jgi:hypothetical protein
MNRKLTGPFPHGYNHTFANVKEARPPEVARSLSPRETHFIIQGPVAGACPHGQGSRWSSPP